MIRLLKILAMILTITVVSWIGWKTYLYFFDMNIPHITVGGLENGSYYCSEVQFIVASDKRCKLSIWLDGQFLASGTEISRPEQECPFIIPTRTISNGKHILRITAVDMTYYCNKAIEEREFTVDNVLLQAVFVKPETEYKVFQGRTLHIQFQVNKGIRDAKVRALAKTWDCFPEVPGSLIYECFLPIACEEQPNEYLFSVELTDKVGNVLNLDSKFQVVFFPFKSERLQIKQEKLKEEQELGLSEGLEQTIELINKNSPGEKLWRGSFCTPIDVERITCEYGTVRTTQEKGRYIHRALDIINTPKSVVWAPQDGIVVLKERYASSGNTVVIDHGCGVLSLFFHLDSFTNIEVGQKIVKGNPLGTIGKTGYATGYHLHWEQRVNNIAVDPMQWTKATF
ncbi:M23 family metallopeptidase [Candidatus Dependentiae bacterium]|nr:MAG: M23 family metallopeptidase [Candidatus Dependentiae bacterium]